MVEKILVGNIQTPIIIAEGWDVYLYNSIADAEGYMEPIDVEDAIYKGYDAEGKLLTISTDGKKVFISAAEDGPKHARELEDFLRECLARVKEKAAAEQSPDLPSLLKACERFNYIPPRSPREFLGDLMRRFFRRKQ